MGYDGLMVDGLHCDDPMLNGQKTYKMNWIKELSHVELTRITIRVT